MGKSFSFFLQHTCKLDYCKYFFGKSDKKHKKARTAEKIKLTVL